MIQNNSASLLSRRLSSTKQQQLRVVLKILSACSIARLTTRMSNSGGRGRVGAGRRGKECERQIGRGLPFSLPLKRSSWLPTLSPASLMTSTPHKTMTLIKSGFSFSRNWVCSKQIPCPLLSVMIESLSVTASSKHRHSTDAVTSPRLASPLFPK